jgi:phage-related protein
MSLVGGQLSQLGGGFAQVGNVIQGFAAGGVAGAAVVAVGEIAKGLQDCIKEATASEAVFASLSAAVTRSGTAWDTVSAATKNALLAMQKTTTYSDEQLAAALERLLTFGLSYDDAMKALGKTLDFAAAKHMDLESAATIVGKAMDGNTAILKRYGIDVTTSKDAAAALKDVLTPLGTAFAAMSGDVADFASNLVESVGVTAEFAQALGEAKDPAKFLIEQFQQGNIDLPQFAQILTDLGVPLDATKMKAGGAEEVLAQLNTQFGGAAQAAAGTYAGIQERLKNATSELGEKIGGIVLPALAGMTEAMIPIVDWLGKGVDAIQAWMTEVGKMPEVKAATEAVGEAWKGLMGWFDSAAKSAQEVLGPALNELWGALKELYTALEPIFAAFKELWDAITGSQGDFDAFRLILEVIKLDIEASVAAIRIIIEVVKTFAQAFKAAADFIAPVLGQIVSAISGFVKAIQDSFNAFYKWFVGGSLWQDLWNAIIKIMQAAVPVILSILSEGLLGPAVKMLSGLGAQVQELWTAAWTGLAEKFTSLTSAIQGAVSSVFEPLGAYLGEMFTQWAQWASDALTKVEGAITSSAKNLSAWLTSFMGTVYQAWVDFGAAMSNYMNAVVNAIIGIVKGAAVNVQVVLNGMINAAQAAANTIAGILSQIWTAIQNTINQAAAAAGTAGNAITNAFTSAWNTVANAATSFYNWLVGGSLWPDLMDALVTQTEAGMDEMKAAFASGFGDVMINAPTGPSPSPATSGATSSPSELFSATLPVTVQIDGATVSRVIERRLIANRQLSAWRSA